jgi:hypothetical protein
MYKYRTVKDKKYRAEFEAWLRGEVYHLNIGLPDMEEDDYSRAQPIIPFDGKGYLVYYTSPDRVLDLGYDGTETCDLRMAYDEVCTDDDLSGIVINPAEDDPGAGLVLSKKRLAAILSAEYENKIGETIPEYPVFKDYDRDVQRFRANLKNPKIAAEFGSKLYLSNYLVPLDVEGKYMCKSSASGGTLLPIFTTHDELLEVLPPYAKFSLLPFPDIYAAVTETQLDGITINSGGAEFTIESFRLDRLVKELAAAFNARAAGKQGPAQPRLDPRCMLTAEARRALARAYAETPDVDVQRGYAFIVAPDKVGRGAKLAVVTHFKGPKDVLDAAIKEALAPHYPPEKYEYLLLMPHPQRPNPVSAVMAPVYVKPSGAPHTAQSLGDAGKETISSMHMNVRTSTDAFTTARYIPRTLARDVAAAVEPLPDIRTVYYLNLYANDGSLLPALMFDEDREGDGAESALILENAAARSFPEILFSVIKGDDNLLEAADDLDIPIYSRYD